MKKLLLFSLFALIASFAGRAAEETWVKVTEAPTDWSGDYLIVYEADNVAFNGNLTKLDAPSNTVDVTISNNKITTTDCNFYFTVASIDGGYSIKSQSGYYIGYTGNKNGMNADKTTQYLNTLSVSGGVTTVTCSGSGKSTLKYNKASGQQRFRYYKSGQDAIAFYKKQAGGETPEPGTVAKPTISPADGSKVEYGSTVTVSSAEGTTLVVSYGDVSLEEVKNNTFTITLPAEESDLDTYVVEAYAVDADAKESEAAKATYTFIKYPAAANIKEFLELKDETEAKKIKTPATVIYQNGINLYLKDETGYLYVYGNTGLSDLNNGDVIEAGYVVKYDLYKNLPEAVPTEGTFKKSATAGTVVAPEEATIELLEACNLNEYVSLKKVKCVKVVGENITIADYDNEEQTIAVYDKYELNNVEAGKIYNLEGFYSIFNTTNQVILTKAEEDLYPGGADVTYSKTTSSDVVGKFAVLAVNVNNQEVIAISREDASKGVEVLSDGEIIELVKAQTAVDEFEIVANGDSYYLYGGLENSVSKNRHYLTYSGSELAYVENADANAAVTFEQQGAGWVVKFNDGQYLVYNGTAFVKGDLVATQAEGDAVTPVYVYMSASNVSTGVDSIDADEAEGVAEYYNLNGVKVNVENLTPGLYIVRQGSKVSKQVIR